jgi:SAM-dependent methyltransferase
MSKWERRVSRASSPAFGLEHELRYALVAPLIREAELWLDLGCGTGLAAATALDHTATPAILVDIDDAALAEAQRALPGAQTVRADLASADGVREVRAIVGDAKAVVTCFETLPQLSDFAPCVELLIALQTHCTVILSVPNDAFWSIDDSPTIWGQGAVEELRRVLPDDHVALDQVALAASAIVSTGSIELALDRARVETDRVPSHYVLAFGPRARQLSPLGVAATIDADAQRRRDRERDAELAILAARVAELERAR